MSEQKYTILENWSQLQEDLDTFLKNPYKWLESTLEREIIPPESEGLAMRHHIQQRNLRTLLSIFKMVNERYSSRLNI